MTTVAIIDFAHCGTTMLAGVCETLGVPMVLGGDPNGKMEDQEVVRALDRGIMAELAAKRDAEHPIWGFKVPGAWKYGTLAVLNDPVYLAIYKEPVAVNYLRFSTVTSFKILC